MHITLACPLSLIEHILQEICGKCLHKSGLAALSGAVNRLLAGKSPARSRIGDIKVIQSTSLGKTLYELHLLLPVWGGAELSTSPTTHWFQPGWLLCQERAGGRLWPPRSSVLMGSCQFSSHPQNQPCLAGTPGAAPKVLCPEVPLATGEAAWLIPAKGLTPDTEFLCWGIFGASGTQTKKAGETRIWTSQRWSSPLWPGFGSLWVQFSFVLKSGTKIVSTQRVYLPNTKKRRKDWEWLVKSRRTQHCYFIYYNLHGLGRTW